METAEMIPPTKAEEQKPEAPAKTTKKPSLKRSNFKKLYPDDLPLEVCVTSNPKKAGSKAHAMFEGYFGATTVGEARTAGVSYQSIAYDVARQFIKIG